MIRHEGQGPGRTPAEADTSPTVPFDGVDARDRGTEPTVPLEAADAADATVPLEAADAADATVPLEAADAADATVGAGAAGAADPADAPEPPRYVGHERENTNVDEHGRVDLARLAWLGTVGACLIAVAILVVEGYYGYAAVTFAVAASAALNLT
jgi:hypothetical protein